MPINALGAVPQIRPADVAPIQPLPVGEAAPVDRNADNQLASSRMEAARAYVRRWENWAGMGNRIDTTA